MTMPVKRKVAPFAYRYAGFAEFVGFKLCGPHNGNLRKAALKAVNGLLETGEERFVT
jgi:hypothetical protein